MKIDWKEGDKTLTKLYPREMDEDIPEDVAEPGSFFNFFEYSNDPMDVSEMELRARKLELFLILNLII